MHDIVEERKHRMITGGLTDEEVQSSGRDLSYQSHRSQGATLLVCYLSYKKLSHNQLYDDYNNSKTQQ